MLPIAWRTAGENILQQIGGRARESSKDAAPVCGGVVWTSLDGAPEAPLTHQAMEEFWDFATTAVACRPEEHIVCVKEFLVLFLGFLEFGLCWRERH